MQPASFGALIALAFRLCLRRWWFYLLVALVATIAETAMLTIHVLRDPYDVAIFVVIPVVALIVYVFAATDATGEEASRATRWERILERSWAVIFLQIVQAFVMQTTIAGLLSAETVVLALIGYAVVVLIVYADVNAALEPKVSTLWLIPNGFRRSATLATRRTTVYLTLALVSTSILASVAPQLLYAWLASLHVVGAQYLAIIPFQTLLAVPYSALAVVVYLECLSRDKAATNDR